MTKEEADAALAKAIYDHAMVWELIDPDIEMLGGYGIVAHWQKLDFDPMQASRYTTHFHSDAVPCHVALGFFHVGVDLVVNAKEEQA